MLTKRNHSMTVVSDTVKKTSRLALAALIVCTASIAPSAFAADSPLIDVKVSVKFRLSELEANNGVQKVYAKFMRKAKRSCRSDRAALNYLDQTIEECAADIVEQFIRDAEVETLTVYHRQKLAQAGPVQLASVMP